MSGVGESGIFLSGNLRISSVREINTSQACSGSSVGWKYVLRPGKIIDVFWVNLPFLENEVFVCF